LINPSKVGWEITTGVSADYAYNGKGERIRKRLNGTTTRFRYSPTGELLGEYDQDGQAIREYIYLAGQPVAMLNSRTLPASIDFEQSTILSYGGSGQDVEATVEVEGSSLKIMGNGWKKIAFPYTITADTILEFDYESGAEGEIQGIGFDTDDEVSLTYFKLYGTQDYGFQDVGRYPGKGSVHFVIPVGEYFTGEQQWLTFINDHDVLNPDSDGRFSNIKVYEANDAVNINQEVVYLHTDHLGSVVKATDSAQALVWDVERKPFGERSVFSDQIEMPLGFPGQYYDEESGNYYNYFRTYDPSTGRYLEADPIGILFGGDTVPKGKQLNHLYSYVAGNSLRYSDPFGLEPWDWDGQGDTSVCSYYDRMAQQNPNCDYYKNAAEICRGNNSLVNSAVGTGLSYAWSNGLQDSQSTVMTNIRQILVMEDQARRQEGSTDGNDCTCGNDIDRYHDFAFEFSGIPSEFYGGNLWPQGVPPHPVPVDPRNTSDPRNWFK
jgi:RHS repeat-associated protein